MSFYYLDVLERNSPDSESLSEEERAAKIKLFRRVSVLCQQSRIPQQAYEDFVNISAHYQPLLEQEKATKILPPEINEYFTQETIELPDTAFDLLSQEGIEAAFHKLVREFSALTEPEQKRAFVSQYTSFFNLVLSLEDVKEGINNKRIEQFYHQANESLLEHITQEWREFILRLFGEEYLDDFKYRHALATGEIWPILATRKLLSPVKLVVAILNSINLLIYLPIGHYLYHVALMKIMNLQALSDESDLKTIGKALFELVLAVLPILAFCFLIPKPIVQLISGLPVLALTLDFIASPINSFIRPLAAFIELPPVILTGLFCIAGAGAIYGLINSMMLAGASAFFPYAILSLTLYDIYLLGKFVKNAYELEPAAGIALGLILVFLSIAAAWTLPLSVGIFFDPSMLFLSQLAGCSCIYFTNFLIEYLMSDPQRVEVLPLPTEQVSESIQEATLSGYKEATQSHRFFNTPKHAQYQEKKTAWQQTASFFGGGSSDSNREVLYSNTLQPVGPN